jgi:undecaprenyl diphosphate synthase
MMDSQGLAKSGTIEDSLLSKIDRRLLPKHVAIIMDGNGRWASARMLPRVAGHRAGIQSVREAVETSARLGLEYLTLYAFSIENWKRPRSEIRTLMMLLKEYIRCDLDTVLKNNIRFQAIGRIQDLEESVRKEIQRAAETTKGSTGMVLSIALNYSGRAELVDAFNRLMRERGKNGQRLPVDEESISKSLYTSGIPDPDLLIRTSGEMRISNFLLWQIAYSEIYITSTFWPDFRRKDLFKAIVEYQQRERRYGGIQKPLAKVVKTGGLTGRRAIK